MSIMIFERTQFWHLSATLSATAIYPYLVKKKENTHENKITVANGSQIFVRQQRVLRFWQHTNPGSFYIRFWQFKCVYKWGNTAWRLGVTCYQHLRLGYQQSKWRWRDLSLYFNWSKSKHKLFLNQ